MSHYLRCGRRTGFTLIEVLVALAIISIALLAALRLPGPTVLEREPSTWRECARRTLEIARSVARG